MSTLLIKNIHQLVTCDDEDRVLQNADLYCEDGFIKAIGTALQASTARPTKPSTRAICSATPA